MKNKTCTKCGKSFPATGEFFYRTSPRRGRKLEAGCKKCHNKQTAKYAKTEKGKKAIAKGRKNYRQTLRGRLQNTYYSMRTRCTDVRRKNYHRYGGRGIKCNFKSFQEFVDYVVNILKITTLKQIKGLQVDRIDNDGHYEPGNIRWVTPKENISNKGPWNEKI